MHGVAIDAWLGVVGPAAMPRETIVKLTSALGEVMGAPEVRQRLAEVGFEPLDDTPAQFAASVQADFQRFSDLAGRLGIGALREAAGDRNAAR